ncbi:MAG: hypothetical protein HYY50_01045 [Candidatus Kerfeldbacteria bacterium]|nr:hypothetical protein [Candidatus Kerfeldbacteria bacterium]
MVRKLMFALLLLSGPAVVFAVPTQVPYSGQLTENGQLVNGTRSFTFRIYPVPAGGSPVYSQDDVLNVVNGVYHVMLNVSTTVWDGSDRWLAISVNGGSPLFLIDLFRYDTSHEMIVPSLDILFEKGRLRVLWDTLSRS